MKCKQGDLAVVIGGPLPEWIGVQVTCERYTGDTLVVGHSRKRVCVCKRAWEVSCPHPPYPFKGEDLVISDDVLMPIRPEPDPESVRREEAVSA